MNKISNICSASSIRAATQYTTTATAVQQLTSRRQIHSSVRIRIAPQQQLHRFNCSSSDHNRAFSVAKTSALLDAMSLGNKSIGFLGAGAMASALLNGMINAKAITADRLWISDQSKAQLAKYQTEALKGIHTSTDNSEVAKHCDILILAVKPHIVPIVLKEIAAVMEPGKHLLISIAAGVPLLTIEALLPAGTKAVRVMPNTPSLVGAGAAGIALGSNAHADTDGALVEFMFQCVGEAVVVAENLLDAVTGVSGSGPAYIFVLIEALADGGVRAGLPREIALKLAAQVVYGSAKMQLETQLHPGVLKDQVCSPGGTTIAGVHALEKGAFRSTIINAVMAASDRSKELAAAAASAQANKRVDQIVGQVKAQQK